MKKSIVACAVALSALTGAVSATSVDQDKYSSAELNTFIEHDVGVVLNVLFKDNWNMMRQLPLTNFENQFIVRPNQDTLYSVGRYDISQGYILVEMPETDRYMSLMIYDLDHYIADGGTVVNAEKPVVIVKTGNPVPDIDATVVFVETDITSFALRTLVRGADDAEAAFADQSEIKITSTGLKARNDVMPMPLSQEKHGEMSSYLKDYLAQGLESGDVRINDIFAYRSDTMTDLNRAAGVDMGQGALAADQALYDMSFADTDGNLYQPHTHYTVTVPADIPVDHFWSATVYDSEGKFMDFDINALNDKFAVKNADGSTTLNFGSCNNGEVNCINTGDGSWNLLYRYYGPHGAIADGTWKTIHAELVI